MQDAEGGREAHQLYGVAAAQRGGGQELHGADEAAGLCGCGCAGREWVCVCWGGGVEGR